MKTLVTGATGLLGNNLVRQLVDAAVPVRALSRSTSDPRPLEGLPVEVVEGDIADLDALRSAAAGTTHIIHAAGLVQVGRTRADLHRRVNVDGTRNVLRVCRDLDLTLIHVSTVDACGWGTRENPADETRERGPDHAVPYVATKRAAEDLVLQAAAEGLRAVVVNPAYLLGAWDWKPSSGRMILEIASGRGLLAPAGGNDFCDVSAVAAATIRACEVGRPGERYILGGEALSYREAWSLFAEVTGARAPVGVAPHWATRVAGWGGDLWGAVSGREPDVNSGAVALAALPHHFDDEKARAELGFAPGPLRDTVVQAWDWFKEYGYA